jgi:hypothetical protein
MMMMIIIIIITLPCHLPCHLPCLAAAARLAAICLLASVVPHQRDQAVYTITARVAYNAWLAFHPKQQ